MLQAKFMSAILKPKPANDVGPVIEPAPKAPPRDLPPAEQAASHDRRGPLRPANLIPARARLRGHIIAWMFQAGDAAVVAAVTLGMAAFRPDLPPSLSLIAGLSVLIALSMSKAYAFATHRGLAFHLARLTIAFAAGLTAAAAIMAPLATFAQVAAVIPSWGFFGFVSLYALHAVWWLTVRRWRRNGRLTPNIAVVGATGAAERLISACLRTREVNIIGVFDDRHGRAPKSLFGVPVLGGSDAMLEHRAMPYVDRVVITVPAKAQRRVSQLVERLRVLPNEITLLLDDGPSDGETAAIARLADVPLARISGPPNDEVRAFFKRLQDLVIGSAALLVAAPVMAIIAVLIKLDSPGPALFRQRRHGFNNEEIVVWKFRSMKVQAPQAGAVRQVAADDDRVTRIGRFIRKTSLDELPQIFNVLRGEMSLVGPRPHPVGMVTGEVESHKLVQEYAHRHRMKPGMTGWAAIHGSRGPVDTAQAVRRRVTLDVEYIERQSFWLDLYILAMTIPCLLGDSENVR